MSDTIKPVPGEPGTFVTTDGLKFTLREYYCDRQHPDGPPRGMTELDRAALVEYDHVQSTCSRRSDGKPLPNVIHGEWEEVGPPDMVGGRRIAVLLADGTHAVDLRCGVEGCDGWIRRRRVT